MVKSNDSIDAIKAVIQSQAVTKYKIKAVVDSYMKAIEEIINIVKLLECLSSVIKAGKVGVVMNEVVLQSKVEFNYQDAVEDDAEGDESE